ncbi:mannose-1-phosphate guanylyltransferase/mannose-6-phosphate isomerase [Piscinibacter koreensis]|uniref:mannose-1-phosphate guanylyltransferase n=1 Tax=Piscinibacter koreensis TaxID=2742824 RepID=A0A7Y6NPR6_9BURK|nr:mannose-1-phosphate guanylyltransferase/mannose-6-phosphate isomerase [Schlegelella koreensis]NUZ06982.1 mannose-1-phosphate guanylyltransferase/mannose-6-phosphate isomerase [Schlegelella koreensis]
MAGGSGTRLWPLSRALYPKQFLAFGSDRTLFQQAVLRLEALGASGVALRPPCIIGNEEHRFMVLDQLREIGVEPGGVLLEPVGRNTAPALTLAALFAGEEDPILVVAAADHAVGDLAAFDAALQRAVAAASDGSIVVLGIRPTRPEIGYGYIRTQPGGAIARDGSLDVAGFVEKPDLATAKRYVAEGDYFWNSGMFVLRASTWLAALAEFRPDIEQATRAAWAARKSDHPFCRPDRAMFEAIPSESIDYAVMEPAAAPASHRTLKMVELDAAWSDLGSWDAVWALAPRDADGNALHGDALIEDSRNVYVHASSRLVSAVGLENLVIVETPDAVLVTDLARSQQVKKIVATLGQRERGEANLHRRVHRPWGWYDSIDHGPRFQVKRIMVKPGAAISLQMHHHRAEHWIVVSGIAEVTNGDQVITLHENESTYIPIGRTHRLANRGDVPLEIIEVQSGAYLGEDDIVRFEDVYGRVER